MLHVSVTNVLGHDMTYLSGIFLNLSSEVRLYHVQYDFKLQFPKMGIITVTIWYL